MATKTEFLVAKEKMLVALATISVAISSPVCMQKIFFECSETYRIKNKHPTEQMDSFMGGLIGKVVQSGKSRLQDKTGKLRYI